MPLRVLTIAHSHPDVSAGGAEIAAYQLHSGLALAPGVEAYFLAAAEDPAAGGAPRVRRHRGRADEYVLASREIDHFLFSQPSDDVIAAYVALLSELEPDVVHFHHYTNLGIELIHATRSYRNTIRILFTLHEFLAICHHYGLMVTLPSLRLCAASSPGACARCFPDRTPRDFAVRRQFLLDHFAEVDLFIAPSAFLRDRYIEWGLPAWQIVVQPNGTAAVGARDFGSTAGTGPPNRFAFFGQVHPFKGLAPLLEAFARLPTSAGAAARDARLVVNGAYLELNDEAYVATVRGLLALLDERVSFAGPYVRSQLAERMAGVDWVVVPSTWWENAPLVIEEALAHGRPVLCSDLGGMKEKVRAGLDGFRFPPGDPDALARLMARVAGDRELWRGLQSTLRRPTTIAETVVEHLALYQDRAFGFAAPP
jgi:glycosyltransferase involved in cell wall biosynthesis